MSLHCNGDRKVWCCRTFMQCFFISTNEGLWHFLHFREYDIKGLEEESYLLMTQVPSYLTGLFLPKYDASHSYNPCCLSSHRKERDLQGMSDSVPQEVPRGVVRYVVMTEAGGNHSSPCSRELRQMRWMPHQDNEQRGMSSAVGPSCDTVLVSEQPERSISVLSWLGWSRNLDLGSQHRLCNHICLEFHRLLFKLLSNLGSEGTVF